MLMNQYRKTYEQKFMKKKFREKYSYGTRKIE
jgi:hypothetical protein